MLLGVKHILHSVEALDRQTQTLEFGWDFDAESIWVVYFKSQYNQYIYKSSDYSRYKKRTQMSSQTASFY